MRIITALLLLLLSSGCNQKTGTDIIDSMMRNDNENWTPIAPDTQAMKKYTRVEIITTAGRMVVALYDATPKHRDNFIKLAQNGFYNGVLFHRVIKEFMIQTGDPDSKSAKPGVIYGEGGPGYNVPAEIIDTLYHYRGALAAAREGNDVNPERKSSGSQFYIVSGKQLNYTDLRNMTKTRILSKFITHPDNVSYAMRRQMYMERQDMASMKVLQDEIENEIRPLTDSAMKSIPDRTRQMYATWGGFAGLDTEYTVFGQLVSGFDVLDKIQSVKTIKGDRPAEDIKIISTKVLPAEK